MEVQMKIKILVFAALLILSLIPLNAEFYCKKMDFSLNEWIRLEEGPKPVLVQDIKFEFPSYIGPKKLDIKGVPQAVVNFKNYGESSMKIKLAIALFDEDGNLLGCGTTSSRFGVTRGGKEEKAVVCFNNVKSRLMDSKYFLLTIETD
jgi:hypothetical protein